MCKDFKSIISKEVEESLDRIIGGIGKGENNFKNIESCLGVADLLNNIAKVEGKKWVVAIGCDENLVSMCARNEEIAEYMEWGGYVFVAGNYDSKTLKYNEKGSYWEKGEPKGELVIFDENYIFSKGGKELLPCIKPFQICLVEFNGFEVDQNGKGKICKTIEDAQVISL